MPKNLKKLFILSCVLSSITFITSCSESTSTSELRIADTCDAGNAICAFELTDTVVNHYINMLGKTTEHIVKTTSVNDIVGDITWVADGGDLADNAELQTETGMSCENDTCTASSNPTGFTFADNGNHSVSIYGNVVVNGVAVDLSTVPGVTVDTESVSNAVTYATPTGTTARNVANRFLNYAGNKHRVASVSANESAGTLTFVCEASYHVTQAQVDLAEGGQISTVDVPGGDGYVYYTPGAGWGQIQSLVAVNNRNLTTGVGCIEN